MHYHQTAAAVTAAFAASVMSPSAWAGPYGDDLARCLVSSTSSANRATLVKWIFAVSTLHPAVAPIARIDDKERAALTRSSAELFQNLLTVACRTQTQQAVQYEGPEMLQYSFSVLGQVAMRDLFNDPKVAHGLSDISKYVDQNKIDAVIGKPKP